MECKHCKSEKFVKNGMPNGKQRYKCKICKKTFKEGDLREKYTNEKRERVIRMYLEGIGIMSIERLEGVSNPLIIKWIKKFCKDLQEKIKNTEISDNVKDIEIGGKTLTKGGSGGSFITSGGIVGNDDYFDTEGTATLQLAIVSSDLINFDLFSVEFWFQVQNFANNDYLFGIGDDDDYFLISIDDSGNVSAKYTAQSTNHQVEGTQGYSNGEWHHIKTTVDSSDYIRVYNDGIETDDKIAITKTWAGETSYTAYIGALYNGNAISDCFFQHFFITSYPNTPDWPIILGSGPIHGPIKKVS